MRPTDEAIPSNDVRLTDHDLTPLPVQLQHRLDQAYRQLRSVRESGAVRPGAAAGMPIRFVGCSSERVPPATLLQQPPTAEVDPHHGGGHTNAPTANRRAALSRSTPNGARVHSDHEPAGIASHRLSRNCMTWASRSEMTRQRCPGAARSVRPDRRAPRWDRLRTYGPREHEHSEATPGLRPGSIRPSPVCPTPQPGG